MASFVHPESEDIEIIRQFYSGINRNDIEFVLTLMDVDVSRIEPEEFSAAGIYQGHSDLRKHLTAGRSTWAEGTCEPVDFFSNGNKIVATVHIKVRLNNQSEWIDARIADGFMIKDGLVMEFNSFANIQNAFAWANIAANS
ncbi:nuclear transport factor 2 family protein [Mucilaginibacter terrae]|uniref:Ketosteroid isomerase-like protein n=1 Tax=Mucilaginibacter terrae TaxID=1955052 RepID=A0ABU3GMK7_9SPHI|nr:nuclear transport factor 2 family protein [Mucilaginibacter terrae]MDT3400977.1 ketosteroid isomerase-like protein [Mucilaginibacter terrae]